MQSLWIKVGKGLARSVIGRQLVGPNRRPNGRHDVELFAGSRPGKGGRLTFRHRGWMGGDATELGDAGVGSGEGSLSSLTAPKAPWNQIGWRRGDMADIARRLRRVQCAHDGP